jgi:hypothetical protein
MVDDSSSEDFEQFRKKRLRKFEPTLGLRVGFIEELIQQDDDWSFVIKAHAIVEAALTQLLGHLIGHPRLWRSSCQRSIWVGDMGRSHLFAV